jgi:hypothetical protein
MGMRCQKERGRGRLSRVFVTITLLPLLMAVGGDAFGEVGYSMRGNSQPFHQWDSAFNTSASDSVEEGFLMRARAWDIRPHVAVSAGYNDNVHLAVDEGVSDTYTTVAPGIMLLYGDEGDDYLTVNYAYELTEYANETTLNYDSHLVSMGVHMMLGQLQLHLSDQFSSTVVTDPETAELTTKLQNFEQFNVSRTLSRKTSFMIEQRYEIHDYETDDYIDYDELWLGGWFYHQTLPKIRTLVGGGFGTIDVSDSTIQGDATYGQVNVGLQGRVTAKTVAHVRGGWQIRTFEDDIEDVTEWTGLIGLSGRFSSRTYWGLDFARTLSPSSVREGHTRVANTVKPSIRHILWRDRLSASLSGAYVADEYYDVSAEKNSGNSYWYVTGVLDWHPTELATGGIGYTYTQQESDAGEAEYDQTHIFVRLMINY